MAVKSGGSTSSLRSLPPPCPKSPPEYPDLYGKRRETAKIQMLEREISFLEEELKSVEGLQPASRYCKEVTDFVMAKSDPLIPTSRKNRKSRRFWNWLCGIPCFNLSWICCCCYSGCSSHLKCSQCYDGDLCNSGSCICNLCKCSSSDLSSCKCRSCDCSSCKYSSCKCSSLCNCSSYKCNLCDCSSCKCSSCDCCSCSSCCKIPKCRRKCSSCSCCTIPKCRCKCSSCNCCSCSSCCTMPGWQCFSCPKSHCCKKVSCSSQNCCIFQFPSMTDCFCCRWKCSPKCPKVTLCCNCTKTCCN
ncbi:guanine nucleotide-binding protein subunit gamma 3-like [Hibiscus syriacus]|uniref:guanine nucleotide-binding protein subunit gamma 3-like n=1 Tax=Hibiscus syriacus TaxID=106335 RepID=UPI0019232995|nr:guanine nucleotide-binding protein subunit gamma 3-like [Hibiscus syriacus]